MQLPETPPFSSHGIVKRKWCGRFDLVEMFNAMDLCFCTVNSDGYSVCELVLFLKHKIYHLEFNYLLLLYK